MAVYVCPEQGVVDHFHDLLEEAGAVIREIEDHRERENSKGKLDVPETEHHRNNGEDNRSQGANRTAADLSLCYFRILDMRRI